MVWLTLVCEFVPYINMMAQKSVFHTEKNIKKNNNSTKAKM